jgi:hypothetical protein
MHGALTATDTAQPRPSRSSSPLLGSVLAIACLPLLLGVPSTARAQPSGGPYGPIQQTYEVPATGHVYFVAPDGQADAVGTSATQPTTIESAMARVVTGDTIVMRGGVYRTGDLRLNQGITIQPYADERPVLKGTRVATTWDALRSNVWRTSWSTLFPARPLEWWRREREGMRTPLHRFNNDMVFVDGRMLKSAGWEGELDADSYYIDYDKGHVFIGVDPKDRLVEITAFDNALIRTVSPVHGKTSDRKGPTIRGITFTQYAFRALEIEGKTGAAKPNEEPTNEPFGPADPATYGKEVVGTTLEHVTITYCSRVAGYFRGDGLTIRHSLVSDTSTEGIYVIGSSDVLLEKNIVRRNNVEQLTGYYPAAVKIFNQSHRVTCRDNLVIDNPHSNGIWYDVGNRDAVFVDNWIEGAIDGFFFEISRGAIVAGNVFVRNDKGIRVLNAAGVRVYNNTFVDTPASFERDTRSATGDHFAWHPATGPDVHERDGHVFANNLIVASGTYTRPLLRFEQAAPLCGKLTRPQAEQVDGNVYVRESSPANAGVPLVTWSPAAGGTCSSQLASLDQFRAAAPGLEVRGGFLDRTPPSIFRGPALGRYELLQPLAGAAAHVPAPADVLDALGWSEDDARTPGAYPVRRPVPAPTDTIDRRR